MFLQPLRRQAPIGLMAPTLYGESAILIDASTGTILYDKKCNKKMYPGQHYKNNDGTFNNRELQIR